MSTNIVYKQLYSSDFNWNQANKQILQDLNIPTLTPGYVSFLRRKFAPNTIGKFDAHARPVELINIKTGVIVKASSISDFCKKVKLFGNSNYHLTEKLLKYDGSVYKNWTTVDYYAKLTKDLWLKDSSGNFYKTTGLELKKTLKVAYTTLHKFIIGEKPCLHSLYLQETEIKGVKPKTKFKEILFRRGERNYSMKIGQMEEFSQKYDISRHSLIDLKYGRKASVKGFEFYHGVEKDTKII